jgi:membrane fusion protein (multidrug efflux system)
MNAVVKETDTDLPADDAGRTANEPTLARTRNRVRLPLLIAGPLLILGGATYFYLHGGRYESTDDAYIRAPQASISANISGRVVEVAVSDNQQVKRGETLFRLDQEPYRIAVAEAEAQLARAKLQVEELRATYRQKQADLTAAKDTLAYRRNEFERQKRLLAKGIASQASFDAASHALQAAEQQRASAEQQIAAALASLGGHPDIPVAEHPNVLAAQAQLDRARLNMSYTTIVAPKDGIVTRVEDLQVGDFISASRPVFALVSNQQMWVEANFKEVQLAHMHPGQTAEVTVDALPGRKLTARVVSLSPGTGNEFSVLPAENATGNWVKVVQRVPVRLELEDVEPGVHLQSGLSAIVEVDTQYQRHLFGGNDHVVAAAR